MRARAWRSRFNDLQSRTHRFRSHGPPARVDARAPSVAARGRTFAPRGHLPPS